MTAVRKHDVVSWSNSFLSQLERVRSDDDPAGWRSPEPIRAALEKLELAMSPVPRPSTRKPRDHQGRRHVVRSEFG